MFAAYASLWPTFMTRASVAVLSLLFSDIWHFGFLFGSWTSFPPIFVLILADLYPIQTLRYGGRLKKEDCRPSMSDIWVLIWELDFLFPCFAVDSTRFVSDLNSSLWALSYNHGCMGWAERVFSSFKCLISWILIWELDVLCPFSLDF